MIKMTIGYEKEKTHPWPRLESNNLGTKPRFATLVNADSPSQYLRKTADRKQSIMSGWIDSIEGK